MTKNTIVIGIIALLVGGGIGYFIPHGAAAAPAQFSRGSFQGGNGTFATRGGNNGAGMLAGTIVSKDSGSVTLNTRDGSSHIVLVTPDTTVSKSVQGSMGDISAGTNVIVSGTTNSDGSVSASLIQIRPATATAGTPVSR